MERERERERAKGWESLHNPQHSRLHGECNAAGSADKGM